MPPRSPHPPDRSKRLHPEFLVALALSLGTACSSDDDPLAPGASSAPRLAAFSWQTATPASQGLDGGKLNAMRQGTNGTKILLVVRNDRIVYEWYASGWSASEKHHSASLAKSLVGGLSLLLALGDGRLSDGDAASQYVPDWQTVHAKAGITIRQLASHSSGLEEADQSAGGWEADFWNRTPNPFSVAINRAPLAQPPGSGFRYSSPAFAVLAYAVTASLRGAPQTDILTLLRNRVMNPLGIPGTHWNIGYRESYVVDGLTLQATHGGANLTGRATASLGRLMLRRGDWEGASLLDPQWVDRVLDTSGAPAPNRGGDGAYPRSGLAWFTNGDGVWPALPRDAFAGAGKGHEILLVVPSWNLILVRYGNNLGDPFWEAAESRLFAPLADAVLDGGGPPPNLPPVADFSWSCDDRTCELVDESQDPDGTIAERTWDLGDGATSAAPSLAHTYDEGGLYAVSLTVTDDDGAPPTVSQSLAVALPTVPPSAAFGVSCNGRACTLTDESVDPDGAVVGRSWDLGDGATSSAGTVAHVYAADGEYTVRLEATDADGAADTTSSAVQVANAAPSASLTVSCSGLACQFGDSSTDPEGPVAERAWDFGDGATSQAANPSHTYAAAAAYLVGLTVTDSDGVQAVDSRTVTVAPAPVFTLSARGYLVRRKHRVDLTWSGAATSSVQMYRNGAQKATWANDGFQTDKMDRKGAATYDYRLCEVGTQVCSNTVRVVF